MSSEGKVRVVVRSRRVPAGTVDFHEPIYSGSAAGLLVGARRSRLVLYSNVLDEQHRKAIEEGNRISQSLGLQLEVVDASRQGILRRMLSSLGRRAPHGPTLLVAPLHSERDAPAPQTLGASCEGP
jgi:hypothetical protein